MHHTFHATYLLGAVAFGFFFVAMWFGVAILINYTDHLCDKETPYRPVPSITSTLLVVLSFVGFVFAIGAFLLR